ARAARGAARRARRAARGGSVARKDPSGGTLRVRGADLLAVEVLRPVRPAGRRGAGAPTRVPMNAPEQQRDYCPTCKVAYEPLQEYCLECGSRLPTNRGVVGVLATSWQRRFAWYPGDWIWPVLLFLLLTIVATGAALAANAARERSAPTLVATGPTVTVGPGAAPATVAPTITSTL